MDTSATYQFSFNHPAYKPVWKEINIHSTDTSIVEIIPDDYYMEDTEEVFAKGCNSSSFLNYYPREPRSLSDLSADIAEKVTHYLMTRVGEKFFQDCRP